MALLYGRAGRLTALFGGFRPGQIDSREAENIVERVSPRLQHANPAVVLSAVKVLMIYMDLIRNKDIIQALCRKLAPPLVTLTLGSAQVGRLLRPSHRSLHVACGVGC